MEFIQLFDRLLKKIFIFNVFLYFPSHLISQSGHQKMKNDDFGGPNGPPRKKVSVEPCISTNLTKF